MIGAVIFAAGTHRGEIDSNIRDEEFQPIGIIWNRRSSWSWLPPFINRDRGCKSNAKEREV